jgi:integrase/recombinase XerC
MVRHSRTTRKPPSWLSPKETDRLFRAIKRSRTPIARRDYLIFSVLLGTGTRLGTLVALNVGDVNVQQSTLRVMGKGGVERDVFLSPALRRSLHSFLGGRRDDTEPLFLSNRARRLGARQVELRLEYWLKHAGIQSHCTVHTLRHTFATRLYEQTGDLRLVQRALGHRRVSTTEIYTHIADARLKRAVQTLKVSG